MRLKAPSVIAAFGAHIPPSGPTLTQGPAGGAEERPGWAAPQPRDQTLAGWVISENAVSKISTFTSVAPAASAASRRRLLTLASLASRSARVVQTVDTVLLPVMRS